jgi:hypothetical protein
MEEDGVAGLDVGLLHILLLESRAHIGHGDLSPASIMRPFTATISTR